MVNKVLHMTRLHAVNKTEQQCQSSIFGNEKFAKNKMHLNFNTNPRSFWEIKKLGSDIEGSGRE